MTMDIYYDYDCPFCYIGLHYLNDLIKQYPSITLNYILVETHPLPEEKLNFSPEGRLWTQNLVPQAEAAGAKLVLPILPMPYSNKAIEGMLFLKKHGVVESLLREYDRRIFAAVWQEKKDISHINVILSAMKGLGVDMDIAAVTLKSGEFHEAQKDLNRVAYMDRKIETFPTFVCGNEKYEALLGKGISRKELKVFLDKCS